MAIWKRLTASYAGQFDPTHRFETSWILSPGALFGIRALLSLYAFVTLFTIFGWNGSHSRSEDSQRSFSYFTHLTYWGLAFYYAFSAAHTGSYWLTGTPFLARWPRWLQVAHSMFYSTVVVYPWLVTGKLDITSYDCTSSERKRFLHEWGYLSKSPGSHSSDTMLSSAIKTDVQQLSTGVSSPPMGFQAPSHFGPTHLNMRLTRHTHCLR